MEKRKSRKAGVEMKISTKGIYAIESMVDLALHSADGVESMKNIAERRELSEKYLEQIVGALRKAGLITSTRGAGGGYLLARKPEEIKVIDILQAVESSLIPIECLYKKTDCGINCDTCATRGFWNGLWKEIEDVAESVSLLDLMEKSKKNKVQEDFIEYYI